MLGDRTRVVSGTARGLGRGIAAESGWQGGDVVAHRRSSEAQAHGVVDTVESMDGLGGAVPRQGDAVDCHPGTVETDMVEAASHRGQGKTRDRIPLNWFATVEDVAGSGRSVASEDSSYTTADAGRHRRHGRNT